MKFKLTKAYNYRKNFKNCEMYCLALKSIKDNQTLSLSFRREAAFLLSKIAKKYSKVFIKNACFITGKTQAFYRFFHLSRHQFRKFACNQNLFSIHKASW